MPILDIQCETCGYIWEDLVKYHTALPICPKCGSAFTEQIITTGPAIMGAARQKIHNRAMRGGSGPRVFSAVPRSYKEKKIDFLGRPSKRNQVSASARHQKKAI